MKERRETLMETFCIEYTRYINCIFIEPIKHTMNDGAMARNENRPAKQRMQSI